MKVFFRSLWSAAPDARQVVEAVKAGKTPQRIRMIGTQDEHAETYKNMVESSNEEAIIMEEHISRIPLTLQDLREITDRGVRMRILTRGDLDSFTDISQLVKYAQVKHKSTLPELQLLIVDQREALVNIPHLESYDYTTWSNMKPYVQTMMQVFKDNWIDGLPAQDILPKLTIQKKLLVGLRLAEKSLQALDWTVDVPGLITTEEGSKSSFSLVARHRDQHLRPLVLDLLVEDDALGQILELKAKTMRLSPCSQLLASTRPFYKEESNLADLYSIKLIYAVDPETLTSRILDEANRILE